MNYSDPCGRTDDVRLGKKPLMIAICNSIPPVRNFGLGISDPIDYELANHLKPSGKGKRIADPRNNDWRNNKRNRK